MRKTTGERVFLTFDTVFLVILCVICVYPLYYCLCASLSDPFLLIQQTTPLLTPVGLSLKAYQQVLTSKGIVRGFGNTFFILGFGVVVNLVTTTLASYVLSRKQVYWRKALMMMILITMYFSGGLIPTYLVVRSYGLFNSLWALILPGAMSSYNMIIMRTYMTTIHDSLSESAMIDGADHFTILTRIFLPICQPIVAVMILYYGVGHWNSWFSASIYLSDSVKFPLQLVLRNVLIRGSTLDGMDTLQSSEHEAVMETIKQASVIVATLPILIIYPLLQKYFVGGIMIGSLKE